MFFVYHHYDLERLAELLDGLLARRDPAGPLQPDTIIVPNHGVGRWLQAQLAESQGIAANLELPLLARFIWRLIPQILPGHPDSADFERYRMRWHLYGLLPTVAENNAAIARYLAGEPEDVLRLQLADRLADVFDQYLIYRPGLLYQWEAGQVRGQAPDAWQAPVWRALTAALKTEHRAHLLHEFQRTLAGAKDLGAANLPSAIYCFGLGNLPPEYVKFLYALAKHIDVHFLFPNPCEAYWGDIKNQKISLNAPPAHAPSPEELAIEQGHPLLASLGRGTRDLLRVLYCDELHEIQEPALGDALAYAPPPADHLLARVQTGIIKMSASPTSEALAKADASVQVHACHGPLREVQVLHDQLLDLLTNNPTLHPRDIIVMLPNVRSYAPAIQSVFGAAARQRYVPWSLSDRARNESHPIVQSFQRLLDLPLSRWAASEILALAAVPATMRRFRLDDAALQMAANWIQAAGVRWGFDASTRKQFEAGDTEQNTWQFGLDRLLLGIAQSDEDTLVDGVAPWSQLEGGATSALGNLWYLLDCLRYWHAQLLEPASAGQWQDRLNAMAGALFQPDPSDPHEQASIDDLHAAISVLEDAALCLNEAPLSWQAVREAVGEALAQTGERQPYLSGGVTFCGLTPLRGVPFRVVCLLGMNDGDFPRQESNRAFNILRARPQLGDHNVRDDDRLLILQSLMAARNVFYISYTGQDVAGGDHLAPSPIVGEWLDFLHQYYFAKNSRVEFEQQVITQQPMHPFSRRLFAKHPRQPRTFTFAREWQPASRVGHQGRITAPAFVDGSTAPAPETDVIELSQLRRFFDHPAKYFLRDCLQINFESLDDEIEDSEPLALGGLEGWQLRRDLLTHAQASGSKEIDTVPNALWRARGVLPPWPLDAESFAEQAEQVNELLPIWNAWTAEGAQPAPLDIDLNINGQRLAGRIADVWPNGPRLMRPGSLRMQYKLRAWIDYLAYRAAGHEGRLRLAGIEKDKGAVEFSAHIDPSEARARLGDLVGAFLTGHTKPLLFMPDLAQTYLEVLKKDDDADKALHKVNYKLTDTFRPSREAQDPYFAPLLLLGAPVGSDPDDSDFGELAERICLPPFMAMTEIQA